MLMELAVVRDLHKTRLPATPEELAELETDVLVGFVLARASAGLTDATIRGDVGNLEQVRVWFGRPLWELESSGPDLARPPASGERRQKPRREPGNRQPRYDEDALGSFFTLTPEDVALVGAARR